MEETLYGGVPPGRKKTDRPTVGVQRQQATKKAASAPPLQTRAPQASQSLSMADMLGALEEYTAPRAAPQGQPAAMDVEGMRALPARAARGRATLPKAADIEARKAAKMQREQAIKQRKLLAITMARQQGIPVETFKALQMMDGRIKYATMQMEAQEQLVQSLEQKLAEARALLEEKAEEVEKQNALAQYVSMKGKEGKVITTQEITEKGMDVMEGGKKKTQRRRR